MSLSALEVLLEVVFPRRCVGCGAAGWPFCATCRRSVAVLSPPGCARCGRPLEREVRRCADCPPPAIAWSRSAFAYDDAVRSALMRLKFGGMRSVASAFVPSMVALADDRLGGEGSDPLVVTWVPLGRRRRRERGFDQAEILARAVASRTGRPAAALLDRVRETGPQARRSGPERRRALSGAFRSIARPPPQVILVDDVLTTGATAQECARTLRLAGAGEVGVLTAARSLGGANGPVPSRCYTSNVWILS